MMDDREGVRRLHADRGGAIAHSDPDVRRAVQAIDALRRRIAEAAASEHPEQALELAFALSIIDASLGEAVRELYDGTEGGSES